MIFMSDSWETTTTSKEAWSRIVIIIWMAWGFPFWQCFWIRRHYVVMLRCGGIIVLTWCNGGDNVFVAIILRTCSLCSFLWCIVTWCNGGGGDVFVALVLRRVRRSFCDEFLRIVIGTFIAFVLAMYVFVALIIGKCSLCSSCEVLLLFRCNVVLLFRCDVVVLILLRCSCCEICVVLVLVRALFRS